MKSYGFMCVIVTISLLCFMVCASADAGWRDKGGCSGGSCQVAKENQPLPPVLVEKVGKSVETSLAPNRPILKAAIAPLRLAKPILKAATVPLRLTKPILKTAAAPVKLVKPVLKVIVKPLKLIFRRRV